MGDDFAPDQEQPQRAAAAAAFQPGGVSGPDRPRACQVAGADPDGAQDAELLGGHLRAAPTDTGGFDLLVTLGAPA